MKSGVLAATCANTTAHLPILAFLTWWKALKNVRINPRIRIEEEKGISFAVSCRHCEEPLCVKSCITGALTRENGVITFNHDKCVGCYTCILSVLTAQSCLLTTVLSRNVKLCLKNASGSPACVQHCPNQAIVYEER